MNTDLTPSERAKLWAGFAKHGLDRVAAFLGMTTPSQKLLAEHTEWAMTRNRPGQLTVRDPGAGFASLVSRRRERV